MSLKQGDYVLLLTSDRKSYLIEIKESFFYTHKDFINLAKLVNRNYGDIVYGEKGEKFYILKPTIYDFLIRIERITQIVYPKDIGYILLKLDISPGKIVIECGGGSGALTSAFAYMVGEEGKVISYEKESRFQEVAKKNLKKLGIFHRVIFKNIEVTEKFEENEVDAIFLDLKTPWNLIKPSWESLKSGHPLGILVPTANQVCQCLAELEKYPFLETEVIEILIRQYKPNPERLRPEDRMVAHTGYLIFAKKVIQK